VLLLKLNDTSDLRARPMRSETARAEEERDTAAKITAAERSTASETAGAAVRRTRRADETVLRSTPSIVAASASVVGRTESEFLLDVSRKRAVSERVGVAVLSASIARWDSV
jgi:hypothetical protein